MLFAVANTRLIDYTYQFIIIRWSSFYTKNIEIIFAMSKQQ